MSLLLHVIEEADAGELGWLLLPLLEQLPGRGWPLQVYGRPLGEAPEALVNSLLWQRGRRPFGSQLLAAAAMRKQSASSAVQMIHAWGIAAGYQALRADWTMPVAVTVYQVGSDTAARRQLALLRDAPQVQFLALTKLIRRRLLEAGVQPERVAVIYPGYHFGELQPTRMANEQLSEAGRDSRTIKLLLPSLPLSTAEIQAVVWMVAIAKRYEQRLQLFWRGRSGDVHIIRQYAQRLPIAPFLNIPPATTSDRVLLTAVDLVLWPTARDISTTLLTAAMAANVPVLAIAGYSATEFIAEGVNGFLVKNDQPFPWVEKLLSVLADRVRMRQMADVARGQAYENFSRSRYLDQTLLAYRTLLDGRHIGETVTADLVEV
ncbi:MAG: D-inositol-3-phosphate glycosyltransferase [Phycisphaerae bacterium]|nr:D-inositol-3-phosphate glycosyltransferase [Phycisphaerae bacterium]